MQELYSVKSQGTQSIRSKLSVLLKVRVEENAWEGSQFNVNSGSVWRGENGQRIHSLYFSVFSKSSTTNLLHF